MRVAPRLFLFFSLALLALQAGAGPPLRQYQAEEVIGELELPPGKGPFPAVILMHGCSGLTAAVGAGMEQHSGFLLENGYATLVLDSFSQRDKVDGVVCDSLGELERARHYRQRDAIEALLYLQVQPEIDAEAVFLMGQSNGGSVALALATGKMAAKYPQQPRFRAIAAYYPWCGALSSNIEIPLLVLGAAEDDWVSPAACDNRKPVMKGADYEVVIYEQAHHSFDLPTPLTTYAGHTVGGNEAAAAASRQKMLEWFELHR